MMINVIINVMVIQHETRDDKRVEAAGIIKIKGCRANADAVTYRGTWYDMII